MKTQRRLRICAGFVATGVALLALLTAPVQAAGPVTRWVDDDGHAGGGSCSGGGFAFKKVQNAVNASAAHDIVMVCPGVYVEEVSIIPSKIGLVLRAAVAHKAVIAATPTSTVGFSYSSESDHVPYPIPASPLIEGGSDRHLLMVDPGQCRLWELFAASRSGGTWHAGSGATWDLTSNALRPDTWTSADAAGLPIFPGLVRYDEVAAGAINHALRFTAPSTCAGYIYPARHEAGSGSCTSKPPMGLRVRLKASVNISGFSTQAKVVLTALKTYGMILADNGSPWYVTGAPDSHWDDDGLHALQTLHGSDFEVVDTSGLVNGP